MIFQEKFSSSDRKMDFYLTTSASTLPRFQITWLYSWNYRSLYLGFGMSQPCMQVSIFCKFRLYGLTTGCCPMYIRTRFLNRLPKLGIFLLPSCRAKCLEHMWSVFISNLVVLFDLIQISNC